MTIIYLEDGMDKNCYSKKRPLESTKHKNGEDSDLGLAKPTDCYEFKGGTKMTFIYL